jgi:electron transfer flavoprotein beta subunit
LKIVVCIKQVPDSTARVDVSGGEITWGDAPLVINPWDEYAIETALTIKDQQDAQVILVSVGPESAKEALKNPGLAMGCDEAILVSDPGLAQADSAAIARVLAATIRKLGQVDLVVCGRQAIDGEMGVTAAMMARVLGWPALSLVSKIRSLDNTRITVERAMEEGRQVVEATFPVVMSVSKDIGEPRYPSFMGIRKAARAVVPAWTLADLEISVPTAVVRWPEVWVPPSRQVSTEIISGNSPEEVARNLVEKILAEKVL